jgi:hypothetical protein
MSPLRVNLLALIYKEEKLKIRLLASLSLSLLTIALGLLYTRVSVSSANPPRVEKDTATRIGYHNHHDHKTLTLVYDVAINARTFRLNKGGTLLDALRGDGFIVNGKIYPAGTIPPGGTPDNPGTFDPDSAPGSIGTFVCRGTFFFDIGEILTQGREPHVYSTQHFEFNNQNVLVADGPEGGRQLRAVIGGMGNFSGASGEVTEDPIGVNATGLFNYRFTFKIKKESIR